MNLTSDHKRLGTLRLITFCIQIDHKLNNDSKSLNKRIEQTIMFYLTEHISEI